uniref:Uncharacterized protein n=1 Tax=Lepeophtheirus salmonis TaxID=72036 RepID=A0A0K2VKL2_LEPSM
MANCPSKSLCYLYVFFYLVLRNVNLLLFILKMSQILEDPLVYTLVLNIPPCFDTY